MRARYLALVFLIALIAIPTYAGFVYYVNGVSGNDASPGTQAAPWKTIQKAANTLQAGDTVIVSAGTYPERVTITRSGTSGSMISYTANGTVSCQGFTVNADFIKVKGFKVTATQPVWTDKGYGIWVEANSVLSITIMLTIAPEAESCSCLVPQIVLSGTIVVIGTA